MTSNLMIYTRMMMTTLNQLHIRPAQSTDRESVIEWCNQLWNGDHDYIDEVWDAWQAEGNLFVGCQPDGAAPVTLLRLRQLSPTEAWFGGLRVHPALQGRGVGRQLIAHAFEWARQRGATTLGYMTETANERMHHLGAALGFRHLGTTAWHTVAAITPRAAAVTHDAELVDLAHAPNLAAQGGLYFYGWAVQRLTIERLRQHAAAAELLVNTTGSAWLIHEMQADDLRYISHAEGNAAELRELIAHVFTSDTIRVMCPIWHNTPLAEMAQELGFAFADEQYSIFAANVATGDSHELPELH